MVTNLDARTMFQVFCKDKIYVKLRDEKLFMLTTLCGSEKFSETLKSCSSVLRKLLNSKDLQFLDFSIQKNVDECNC